MKKVIFCDPDQCTGCQICEIVCSATKENKLNPILSRIRLVRFDPHVQIAITCQLCDQAPCIRSCPRKAISVNKEGRISIDETKCVFCGWCIHSCPFGAIIMNPLWIRVCDLCDGEPKCVEHCPKEALIFATRKEIAQRIRRESVKELMSELNKSQDSL